MASESPAKRIKFEKHSLDVFYKFVDGRADDYVDRLREAVAIPSVSAWPGHRPKIESMMDWTKDWIEKLGGTVVVKPNPIPEEDLGDGTTIPNPPILLASFDSDPSKRTVCVYGHLDVQTYAMTDQI